MFDNTLDENEKTTVDANEYGVMYESTLRSESKEKIEKIQKIWDEMQNEE